MYDRNANGQEDEEDKFTFYLPEKALGSGFRGYAKNNSLKLESCVLQPEEPEEPEQPEQLEPVSLEGFRNITLTSFKDKDTRRKFPETMELESTSDTPATQAGVLRSGNNFDKTLLSLWVTFGAGLTDKRMDLVTNANDGGEGIRFQASNNSSFAFRVLYNWNDYKVNNVSQTISIKATDLLGEGAKTTDRFLLQMSIEYGELDSATNEREIKIGLYANGKMYDRNANGQEDEEDKFTFYLLEKALGSGFRPYTKNNSLKLESCVLQPEEPEEIEDIVTLNESFKKITFDHFTVADGTYTNDGTGSLRYSGRARVSLDKTVFSGDVFIPEGEQSCVIFGGKNAWDGLRFTFNVNRKNDQLNIGWYKGKETEYLVTSITSAKAQTKMVGEWLNIKISTEIIDYDKDGQKNDIRFAVWFNDILYSEEYLIVRDKAQDLGSYMGIVAEKGCSISVRSVRELIEPFNFAMFGLTNKWQETLLNNGLEAKITVGGSRSAASPTGDDENMALPICGVAISIFGYLTYVVLRRKKSSSSE